jgi:hypothetical protein
VFVVPEEVSSDAKDVLPALKLLTKNKAVRIEVARYICFYSLLARLCFALRARAQKFASGFLCHPALFGPRGEISTRADKQSIDIRHNPFEPSPGGAGINILLERNRMDIFDKAGVDTFGKRINGEGNLMKRAFLTDAAA